jgi:hypothetical protein
MESPGLVQDVGTLQLALPPLHGDTVETPQIGDKDLTSG